jgi:hypothetical protein
MTDKKTPEIIFAPGCFDQFDGTQEELDELMAKIQEMFASGEAQAVAVPLSELMEDLTEEELKELLDEVGEEIGVEELGYDFPQEYNGKRTLH